MNTLKQHILAAVENQLCDESLPEAKETYERLQRLGISESDAKVLIGQVLTREMFECATEQRTFNRENYVQRLNSLPTVDE